MGKEELISQNLSSPSACPEEDRVPFDSTEDEVQLGDNEPIADAHPSTVLASTAPPLVSPATVRPTVGPPLNDTAQGTGVPSDIQDALDWYPTNRTEGSVAPVLPLLKSAATGHKKSDEDAKEETGDAVEHEITPPVAPPSRPPTPSPALASPDTESPVEVELCCDFCVIL